ncbi:phosphoglycolate phosphatase [Aliikangiella coralliicola]|uniref:Phosphoglycolate phosphatase n=2 Tax=Aliikangiella coralliicola TaxID=2592383 RepID=A0A545U9E9_9GAMM|nr:phosphoglycolate phosphatase [Aliikangiella coralliicola]
MVTPESSEKRVAFKDKVAFKGKKVLLFDLDGTLIDSAPDLALAANLMLAELQMPEFSQEVVRSWVGNGAKTLVQRALSGSIEISPELDAGYVDRALERFLQFYQANVCNETQLYEGVRETLQRLKDRGYKLTIVTNKPEQFVTPILKSFKLNEIFELVVAGDTLAKKKPDPAQLNYVCQQLSVSVQQCLMIGDSKNDILAAKAISMESIGLTYGYNYGESISIFQPEIALDHFSNILDVLS